MLKRIWQGLCWDGWQDFDTEEECIDYTKAVLGDQWDESRVRLVLETVCDGCGKAFMAGQEICEVSGPVNGAFCSMECAKAALKQILMEGDA